MSINDDGDDKAALDSIFKGNSYIQPAKKPSTHLSNLNISGEQMQLDTKSKRVAGLMLITGEASSNRNPSQKREELSV